MMPSSAEITLLVNGAEVTVPRTHTVMQACEEAGAIIPRFCYHQQLSIAGNCRMCLVEAVGAPKPIASCAYSVADLRPPRGESMPAVSTESTVVKQARERVLSFILANHPLDCPICDQGGECDLQDQAKVFGMDRSFFSENKRAVEDKYIGPLVKTEMNRCIHCTRCVRFISEIAGTEDLGATGRGEDMEITTYLEAAMSSELQGNIVDLCPVGALTSRPYAFSARPWELSSTQSIDVQDAAGSAIQIDSRENQVMRIQPGFNPAINQEWLADRSRFVWDGLKTNRLDQPWLRVGGETRSVSWSRALNAVATALQTSGDNKPRIAVIAGPHCALEELVAVKDLLGQGENIVYESRTDGNNLHPDHADRAGYILNCSIRNIERADSITLIGTNPRLEAPIINMRIRKAWLNGGSISYLGAPNVADQLNYPTTDLGSDLTSINKLKLVGANNQPALNPLILVGSGALQGDNALPIIAASSKVLTQYDGLREDWFGFGILPSQASQVGALDVGFVPDNPKTNFNTIKSEIAQGAFDVVWLIGCDVDGLICPESVPKHKKPFVIYQGSHGDIGVSSADVILPAAAYTEKLGTYVNAEGRVQQTSRAVFPPGQAREDWSIIRALSALMNRTLPYNDLAELHLRMFEQWPHLQEVGRLPWNNKNISKAIESVKTLGLSTTAKASGKAHSIIDDPWATNPITRSSAVMRDLSRRWRERNLERSDKTETEDSAIESKLAQSARD